MSQPIWGRVSLSVMTTEQEYRTAPLVNASMLKAFLQYDHRIAKHKILHPSPPTDAMTLGSLLHDLMEHKGEMGEKFVTSEYDNFRTKEAQAWKKEMIATGRVIVTDKDWQKAQAMRKSIVENAPSWMFGDDCEHEKAFYTEKEKALCDLVHGNSVVDWKTTSATSAREFVRECSKYNYYLQAKHYLNVTKLKEFWFVAVSTVEPYPVWTFRVSEDALSYGQSQIDEAYKRMEESPELELDLDPPSWWSPESKPQENFDI